MVLRKAALFVIFSFLGIWVTAQTLGGQAAYTFLKLPSSPFLAAAGGVNVSYVAGEVSLTANNPALLQRDLASQLNSSYNSFIADTRAFSLTGALHSKKLGTTFGGHLHYLDYGMLPYSDAAGNVIGQFRPVDFVVQASAARVYLEKWSYGLTLKFIGSSYGLYRSNAVAADVGVLFHDTAVRFSVSLVVKNMGTPLKNYTTEGEELPFDLQVGVTKRLEKAPLGFSVTARHLQRFNLLYNDTSFNRDNNISTYTSALAKVLSHVVLATHIYVGQNLEATIGYNILQRRELRVGDEGNGLTGFTAGMRVRFNKLQVLYARSAYQRGIATNQIGITLHLDKLFGF